MQCCFETSQNVLPRCCSTTILCTEERLSCINFPDSTCASEVQMWRVPSSVALAGKVGGVHCIHRTGWHWLFRGFRLTTRAGQRGQSSPVKVSGKRVMKSVISTEEGVATGRARYTEIWPRGTLRRRCGHKKHLKRRLSNLLRSECSDINVDRQELLFKFKLERCQ